MPLYIGLMSGTSLDGIDAVLAAVDARAVQLLGHLHRPFPPDLRAELLALNTTGADELNRAALAANEHVRVAARLVADLLDSAQRPAADIRAVGAHGQTVRHRPVIDSMAGYTLQLNNGALLAELTGIDVVCDFRSRDVAAGGQGAPLVPAFHAAVFTRPGRTVAVLNLGGIGNLTLLGPRGEVSGFDCGPANALLDGWCERHTGRAFDDHGRWAASGQVLDALLAALMSEPYLRQRPPKSTGRDLFNLDWLDPQLVARAAGASPVDVQATLAEYTALTAAHHLQTEAPDTTELLVCGGGSLNDDLMQRLARRLPGVRIRPTDDLGVPAMQVEAAAFAWLAHAFIQREPGNVVAVTGARGPRVLGALYPAR